MTKTATDTVAPKPRLHRYLLAALIAAVAAAALLTTVTSADRATPAVDAKFPPGEPATVQLAADQPSIVYLRMPPAPTGAEQCTASALTEGTVTLRRLDRRLDLRPDGDDATWRGLYEVRVDHTGRYELTCGELEDRGSAQAYGVGPDPDTGVSPGGMALAAVAVAALLGAAVLGLLAARRRRPLPGPPPDVPPHG